MTGNTLLQKSAEEASGELSSLPSYRCGFGATPIYASLADRRFSYTLYVPRALRQSGLDQAPLLVAIHGTGRDACQQRDVFIPFAEKHGAVVLSPLFACGIDDPSDRDAYKYLLSEAVDYPGILLSMIEEVRLSYGLAARPIMLFGFSGGAHFAHRFAYLHPEWIAAAAIASPGSVTMLEPEQPWWVGTADFQERFGRVLDVDILRSIPLHVLVGDQDLDREEITHMPGGKFWMTGANSAGDTRIERARSLHRNWAENGLKASIELVEGAGHQLLPLARAASQFFDKCLQDA